MPYATIQERQHIAAAHADEACAAAQAVRLADLELSPLADALKALLAIAEETLANKSATEDERMLAEKILDAHGPSDDCWTISEAAS